MIPASIRRAKNDVYPGWIKKGTVFSDFPGKNVVYCIYTPCLLAFDSWQGFARHQCLRKSTEMRVYVRVYVWVCVYVCECVCMCVCTCVSACVCDFFNLPASWVRCRSQCVHLHLPLCELSFASVWTFICHCVNLHLPASWVRCWSQCVDFHLPGSWWGAEASAWTFCPPHAAYSIDTHAHT